MEEIIDMKKYLKNNNLNKNNYYYCIRKIYYNPTETHYILYKASFDDCEEFIKQDKKKTRGYGPNELTYEICFDKRF
tara:strand:+ start:1531 stop:1761 length:231 start_codon:yes stop_codon:yes gene_type:complete